MTAAICVVLVCLLSVKIKILYKNSKYLFRTKLVPGTCSVLTLTTTCKVDTYLYLHFTDRETEAQRA